jgi:hypothetical protein
MGRISQAPPEAGQASDEARQAALTAAQGAVESKRVRKSATANERHCHSSVRAFLNQRSDQPQQLLLLWALASPAEKGSDVDIGNLAA